MTAHQKMLGALIGLARTAYSDPHTPELIAVMLDALAAEASAYGDELDALQQRILAQKRHYAPNCADCASPCGRTADFDLSLLEGNPEKQHLLRALHLFGCKFCGKTLSAAQEQLLFDALGIAEEPHSVAEILQCAAQLESEVY